MIGEYESLLAAAAAVRNLESHGFSIQNVIIADQGHRMWRRLHASGTEKRDKKDEASFLVFMIDAPESIARARAALQHFAT